MPADTRAAGYDAVFDEFDSPLARRIREEAYGEDIGQHSWVTVPDLLGDIERLRLTPASRLLDLGCGPCGPLTFVLRSVGCAGTGIEMSGPALAAGRARAKALGVDHRLTLALADLEETIPFPDRVFHAAMSLDVVIHLRDRAGLFGEVARVLARGGRFLLTDAGVLTGVVSDEEILRRSVQAAVHFHPPGHNEGLLEAAGFRVLETGDWTPSLMKNAEGRRRARTAHRDELEKIEGAEFERHQQYLETVIEIARRGAVQRRMYLAEVAS